MKELYIVGAGSVGGYIATNFNDFKLKGVRLAGFLDDNPAKQGNNFCGVPIIGPVSLLHRKVQVAVIMGIAFPKIKEKLFHSFLANSQSYEFPTLVSPFAWVSKNVNIAQGSIIYPGCSINYACHIEEFVVMNMNCAIGHDCHIGAFSSLAPGVNFGGNTRIGKGCDVGIGVATKQQVDIGDYSIIGGQAMVVRNVEKKSTIAGVPGKPIINS